MDRGHRGGYRGGHEGDHRGHRGHEGGHRGGHYERRDNVSSYRETREREPEERGRKEAQEVAPPPVRSQEVTAGGAGDRKSQPKEAPVPQGDAAPAPKPQRQSQPRGKGGKDAESKSPPVTSGSPSVASLVSKETNGHKKSPATEEPAPASGGDNKVNNSSRRGK